MACMRLKVLIGALVLVLSLADFLYALDKNVPESDQQINEFSLAGYGEKGKKTWDLSGKSADIFDNIIKLNDIAGNLYGEKEDINLTAKSGDFDKSNARIHLEDNVVITSSSGAKLTTEHLDWDRKAQIISTDDIVNIKKDNMVTTARGAQGKTDLKQVNLKNDVKVNILSEPKKAKGPGDTEKITITCDGALEIDYEKNVAVFNKNVKVVRQDLEIDSDKMEVYFLSSDKSKKEEPVLAKAKKEGADMNPLGMSAKIDRIFARGNVKIVRGDNTSYSDEAMYNAVDKKITLLGRPRLVIFSAKEFNASLGN